MDDKQLLLTIEIPNYVRKIKLSDSRRAKYWLKHKVLAGKQKLPKKYLKKVSYSDLDWTEQDECINIPNKNNVMEHFILNKDVCYWKEHKLSKKKTEWRLTDDATDEYIIKNTKVAGTENWHVINSQKITNHTASPFTNGKVVKAIHDEVEKAIRKKFENLPGIPNIKDFPIRILMELHDFIQDEITQHRDWDVQNRCDVWGKAFVDCLTEMNIIPDDHRAYVTQPPVPLFCPLWMDGSTPKLIFKIYHDRRTGISKCLEPYRKGRKIAKTTKLSRRK